MLWSAAAESLRNTGLEKPLAFIHSSKVLQPFVGPWPLLQFRNFFTQSVGLLGRMRATT
jgi:hypothetical protein